MTSGITQLLVSSLVLALSLGSGCVFLPHAYRGASIEFTVVDDVTGQPLPDVVVTANWQLIKIAPGHPVSMRRQLAILEAVSDGDGRVTFPAWGPKVVGPCVTIDSDDPKLVLFKEGYLPRVESNRYRRHFETAFTRRSDWDGGTLRLERRATSEREYAEALDTLGAVFLHFAFGGTACEWRQVPTMVRRARAEAEKHRSDAVRPWFWDDRLLEERAAPARCGSLREFLARYSHES